VWLRINLEEPAGEVVVLANTEPTSWVITERGFVVLFNPTRGFTNEGLAVRIYVVELCENSSKGFIYLLFNEKTI